MALAFIKDKLKEALNKPDNEYRHMISIYQKSITSEYTISNRLKS